jgi:16S rRNA (guanine966-N2)-methyltransferase
VTRIIGGSAGGRRIKTPTGNSTRPTSDRVREALFSAIDSALGSIAGLRFLDLYAGSGAVGLEAASRGAGVVTLVEHDRRTAALIRENAAALAVRCADLVTAPVVRALAHHPRAPYDIAFADPPYAAGADEITAVLEALRDQAWLSAGALVVVERSSHGEGLTWPAGFTGDRCRKYGDTALWYGHAATTTASASKEP